MRAQVVVAAVVAGVALGVRNGSGQLVDFCRRGGVHAGLVGCLSRRVAGRTAGEVIIPSACLHRLGGEVTGKAILLRKAGPPNWSPWQDRTTPGW